MHILERFTEKTGASYASIAKGSGVTVQALLHWRKDRRTPKKATARLLIAYMNSIVPKFASIEDFYRD